LKICGTAHFTLAYHLREKTVDVVGDGRHPLGQGVAVLKLEHARRRTIHSHQLKRIAPGTRRHTTVILTSKCVNHHNVYQLEFVLLLL